MERGPHPHPHPNTNTNPNPNPNQALEPNTVLLDNALATMGAGLPAAIAAKIIEPSRQVRRMRSESAVSLACAAYSL